MVLDQVGVEGNPFSYFKGVEFSGVVSKRCDPDKELLECTFPKQRLGRLNIQLHFQGHYEEPPFLLPLNFAGKDTLRIIASMLTIYTKLVCK